MPHSPDFFSQGVLYRVCSHCHKAFPLDTVNFQHNRTRARGFSVYCKPCDAIRFRARWAAEAELRQTRRAARTTSRVAELRRKLQSPVAQERLTQLLTQSYGKVLPHGRELAQRLADHIRDNGLKQTDVARGLGMCPNQVNDYVKGRQGVSPTCAVKVCAIVSDRPHRGVAG